MASVVIAASNCGGVRIETLPSAMPLTVQPMAAAAVHCSQSSEAAFRSVCVAIIACAYGEPGRLD